MSKTKTKTAKTSSQQIHRRPQVSTRKVFRPIAPKLRIFTIVLVVVCLVLVLSDLLATRYLAPDIMAVQTLEEIASDYYENYYYDKVIAQAPEGQSLGETMAKFEKDGFAPVYLRHLLLFDNERNAGYADFFDNSTYACDKNVTSIKITPHYPYGREDYTISYSMSCNYK